MGDASRTRLEHKTPESNKSLVGNANAMVVIDLRALEHREPGRAGRVFATVLRPFYDASRRVDTNTSKRLVSPGWSTMRLLSIPHCWRLKPSVGQVYGSIQSACRGAGA